MNIIYPEIIIMNGAIIGLGHGDRVISKALEIEKINLIGVYSRNFRKRLQYCKINNIEKNYTSIDDLVNDDNIDLVVIAIPAYYQVEIIKKCLNKNKNIFCEKPLTANYNDLKKIHSKIYKSKKKIIVDYIFQEHEAFKKFKNILPKKNLKNSKAIINFKTQSFINKNKINNWKNKQYLGGGIINLYLPHILEYLIFFFGKILSIKIIKKGKNFCIFQYSFCCGLDATINIDSNEPKTEHSITFENNKIKLTLKNISKDYAKGFKITKLNKSNNKKKIISYKNNINKFRTDGRIYLTSKLLKYFSKKFSIKDHLKRINKYVYIESILDKTRKKF